MHVVFTLVKLRGTTIYNIGKICLVFLLNIAAFQLDLTYLLIWIIFQKLFPKFIPFVVLQYVYFRNNVFVYDCTWHKWFFTLFYILGLDNEWVLKFRSRFGLIHHYCSIVILLYIISYFKFVFIAIILWNKWTFSMVVFKTSFWSYIILCENYSSC